MYEDIHTLIHTHTHHEHLYVYTYALPTFLRSLPIAAARECGFSKSFKKSSFAIAAGFSIEHRLLDYSTITTCRGRERGRVLAYVRATNVTLGQAEVHAQQQASATHRRQPLKLHRQLSADWVCNHESTCPRVRVRYACSEL